MKKFLAMLLALCMILSLAACATNDGGETTGATEPSDTTANTDPVEDPFVSILEDGKNYTYHSYLTVAPSNWNELTYQDANDTEIMDWLQSSFFTYDFKYDEYGEIIPGEFVMKYNAATKLEDVTAKYAEAWGLPTDGKGYAYAITLREDLKWNDGTPIKAEDFVYSMEQQLDPLFQNYRADSYYIGSTIIVNAQNFAKQGQSGWFAADTPYSTYSEELDELIVFTLAPSSEEIPTEASFRGSMGFPASYDAAATAAYVYTNYIPDSAFNEETAAAMEGKTMAEIKADETLKAAWDALIGWWQTEPDEELDFFVTNYTYPEATFDQVGIFVGDNEYEIVVVLEKALDLLKEDGSLSYKASYNFGSLPLVKKDLYESCKIAPTEGTDLWTSNYNSSVETTASWGPYMLESFQAGTQYTLARNEHWFGYQIEEYEGLYQTDRMVVDIIDEWNTAWLKFLAGEIDGIGIDVSIADEYKGSERAYFTPSDYIDSLQLQSDLEALKSREEPGINKTMLGNIKFRQALSLSVNRADYATQCTTSSLAGFGIFNSMHYYDVENGGVYRNTDEAKQVLCNIYGVDATQYATLDEAVDAITGYNVELARQLITEAYNEELEAGNISETDKVVLTFGTSTINEVVQRRWNYIQNAWTEAVAGTPLEGRLEFEGKEFSDAWANDFRAGAYDVCQGGWSGAAWDPGYFLLAYLDSGYRYATGWDVENTTMTFTMKGVGENGEDITETMGLLDWYDCLNGTGAYDWSSNALEESQRLQLIAALEQEVLKVYYTVPFVNSFSASLLSYKVDYITYEYNTFMGYGGVKYMTYNYTDEEWATEVAAQNGELNYK